ncbi:MAG: hypothetical protein IPK10_05420 [Bacteroidetes bacterium]|nr:hypothetical protein [Bacteroidota bacterium]
MHGKPKSGVVYSNLNEEISGKRYHYQDEINDLGVRHLTSIVKGVSKNQVVSNIAMGEDIDLVLDMREHLSVTWGIGGRGDFNIVPAPPVPPVILSSPDLSLERVGGKLQ